MAKDYERAIETLMKDVGDLRADLKAVALTLRERAGERAGDACESVRDCVEQGAERIREAAGTAVDAGKRALGEVERKVEEKPLVSLLVAAGVGIVIGCLLHGRSHR